MILLTTEKAARACHSSCSLKIWLCSDLLWEHTAEIWLLGEKTVASELHTKAVLDALPKKN